MFAFCSIGIQQASASWRPVNVALPFTRVHGGFAPCEAVECPHAAAAIRSAEAMSRRDGIAGALAFSRRGNPDLGEFDEAEILKTFGDLPHDFRDASP
jgi:hypothetical protein